ncbi:MAG: LuxR C-terminal-related transcriptional regulator [Dehalococcoidia bacterium]
MLKRGRGRPPHPDILTPREWEVLELIDQGLTNEQIASQLGISPDGAKYHVAQILAKLGVRSRREAGSVARANRGRPLRRWVLFPFLGKLGAGKTVNAIAAGGVVTAGLVALVLLFLSLRSRSGERFDMYPGLYVLDIASGKVERKVDLRDGEGIGVEWTRDGQGLLMIQTLDSAQGQVRRLRLFDPASGALLSEDSLDFDQLSYSVLQDGRLGVVTGRETRTPTGVPIDTYLVGYLDPAKMAFDQKRQLEPIRSAFTSYWSPDGTNVLTYRSINAVEAPEFQLIDLSSDSSPTPAALRFWSPDGTRYVTNSSIASSVAELRDARTDSVVLTFDFGPASVSGAPPQFVWSPDSRWLLNVAAEDLFVVPANGSAAPRSLAKGSFYYGRFNLDSVGPGHPTWSPDSTHIAFLDDDGILQQVDVASGTIESLYEAPLPGITEPRWSPDRTKIAFRIAGTPSISVARLDGSSTYVASGSLKGLSPRGDRIAFDYGADVYTIRPDGKRLTALTDFEPQYLVFTDRVSVCMAWSPFAANEWSPDGNWLIRTRINEASFDDDILYRIRTDGLSSPEELTDQGRYLSWSPDGSRMAYVTGNGGECHVGLADAEGNVLSLTPGSNYRWIGDNHLLVTLHSTRQVLVGPDGGEMRAFDVEAEVSSRLDYALLTPVNPEKRSRDAILIDLLSGAEVRRFEERVTTGVFSPDGRFLILNEFDGATLYDLQTFDAVRSFPSANGQTFSPDGRTLAYVGTRNTGVPGGPVAPPGTVPNNTLMLLDLTNPSALPQEVMLAWGFQDMVWSPESTHLAFRVSQMGGELQVPTQPGQPAAPIRPPTGKTSLAIVERSTLEQTTLAENASRFQWFPDGKRIVYQGD